MKKIDLKKMSKEQIKAHFANKNKTSKKQIEDNKKERKNIDRAKVQEDFNAIKKNRKEDKKEKRDYIEALIVTREVKQALRIIVAEFESKVMKEVLCKFDNEIEVMRKKGLLYKAEYKEIPLHEYKLEKLKELGELGWKFAFVYDAKEVGKSKVILTRERRIKK